MNSKMIAAGVAMVFVAMALPSNAYHIVGTGSNDLNDPHAWTSRVGASFPIADPSGPVCTLLDSIRDGLVLNVNGAIQSLVPAVLSQAQADALKALVAESADLAYSLICLPDGTILGFGAGDGIVGFTVCEQNAGPTAPGHAGFGGLCNMSYGCGGDKSDGTYNAYDGGACKPAADPQPTIQNVGRNWISLQMTLGTAVPFTSNLCSGTFTTLVYDEQYVYTMLGGHVDGFPTQDVLPGTYGTYTVDAVASASGTPCGGALPVYWS